MNQQENVETAERIAQHGRPAIGTVLEFDLEAEIRRLYAEQPWQAAHTANTIVKFPDVRIVLTALKAGGRMKEHRTAGRVCIQALSGQFAIRAENRVVSMTAGKLLTLDQNVAHEVEATTDSVFLLTIVLPA